MDDDFDMEEMGEYESGPFCAHWSSGDCGDLCVCGHACKLHSGGGCDYEGCECEGFADEPEEAMKNGK
jgi:hypothetical protein